MADTTIEHRTEAAPPSPKDQVRALLERLPDTVTLEDIQYHLDVVVKVLEAEASAARGDVLSQAGFERRFAKWLQT